MRIIGGLLLIYAFVVPAPSTAIAANLNSISLRYQEFPDYEMERAASPNVAIPKSKLTKMPKRAKKPNEAMRSATIDKLHELVMQQFGGEQDGFIQLTDSEFIVFVSNTGRVSMGLYRADLAANTVTDQPFAHGEVTLQSLLKDKSGNDYLLLHHSYPMHAGVSGESYSLLSAHKPGSGRVIIDVIDIGEAELSENSEEEDCARIQDRNGIIHKSVDISVKDVNHDDQPDISVTENLFNCATKKTSTRVTKYLATQAGFASATADAAKDFSLARKEALAIYSKGTEFSKTNPQGAAQVLEQAGINQILYEKPSTMPTERYAGLLNDYAFFIGPYGKAEQALGILDRVIQFSPDRGVAYLNRAEVRYEMLLLGQLKAQKEKLNAAKEIMTDYDTYKKLTKKQVEWLEQFSAFNLASYPKSTGVCNFIRRYYEAGRTPSGLSRMDEISIESRHLDINNDGIEEDVEFESKKAGYKTYSAISFHDSSGRLMRFDGSTFKKPDQGWGFKIFAFEGKIYKLHPMDDVSYIDHDKEKLVCESQWGDIPAGGGGRPLLAIHPVN